jgi:hypothetical protein
MSWVVAGAKQPRLTGTWFRSTSWVTCLAGIIGHVYGMRQVPLEADHTCVGEGRRLHY